MSAATAIQMERRGAARLKWLIERITHDGDECLRWPFAADQTGYGRLRFDRRAQVASRVMCILVHGYPPDPKLEAAHSCGNGHLGCVNPKHLRWKTHVGNEADKAVHGTLMRGQGHYRAKLTDEDVREIRTLRGAHSQREIGEMFGVSQSRICEIQRRQNWKHVQ